MYQITIVKQGHCWNADFSRAEDAGGIFADFGTYLLPTAFTHLAAAELVIAELGKQNPGHKIVIGGAP